MIWPGESTFRCWWTAPAGKAKKLVQSLNSRNPCSKTPRRQTIWGGRLKSILRSVSVAVLWSYIIRQSIVTDLTRSNWSQVYGRACRWQHWSQSKLIVLWLARKILMLPKWPRIWDKLCTWHLLFVPVQACKVLINNINIYQEYCNSIYNLVRLSPLQTLEPIWCSCRRWRCSCRWPRWCCRPPSRWTLRQWCKESSDLD